MGKTGLGALLRVEPDDLRPVVRHQGEKADKVILAHGVIHGDAPLAVQPLSPQAVSPVRLLRLQGRKAHPAARKRTLPRGPQDVAADGADIEFAPQEISGAVGIDKALAIWRRFCR